MIVKDEHGDPLEAHDDGIIVAWRCWEVRTSGGMIRDLDGQWRRYGKPGLRLVSWTRDDEWPPLVKYDALRDAPDCVAKAHPKLKRGGHWCQCGIHAFKSKRACLDDLKREFNGKDKTVLVAMGRVNLWGRYVEAQNGWRSRYAYPYDVKLLNCDDASIARELAGTYAIDVTYGPWDYAVEMHGQAWDCNTDGHRWNDATQACTQCGVTLIDYERQQQERELARTATEIQEIVGVIPVFSDRHDAVAWFQQKAAELDGLRYGFNSWDKEYQEATNTIIMLRDAIRPYVDRPHGTKSARHWRALSSGAVSITKPTAISPRMTPPSSTATNKHLPPPRL
jgi:hypothetical protein